MPPVHYATGILSDAIKSPKGSIRFTAVPGDSVPIRQECRSTLPLISSFRLACLLILGMALCLAPQVWAQERGAIIGKLMDPSGAVVVGARVKVLSSNGGYEKTVATDSLGAFRIDSLESGEYLLTVINAGFAPSTQRVLISAGGTQDLRISLEMPVLAQELLVTAPRIAPVPENIPGSVSKLDMETLGGARVFTTSEALRKVPGVNVRDEEGFGLRPNIGIRGVNPTRSTKVLLLEDGVPLSYAPYGDNASYYHPPIDRFESVEIVKGAGQILHGPATVSGVINYLTPAPPLAPTGTVTLLGGNRDYFNGHVSWGGTWNNTGLLVDVLRKQGKGARENQRFGLNDVNAKLTTPLGERQFLTLKGNYYGEDSNVGYSGLREDEFQQDPRQNPFRNDFFYGDRYGVSANHSVIFSDAVNLVTNTYLAIFQRHWWRQSSNSGERPNDRSNPACGGMENLNSSCGIQGRLRRYTSWGIEPRLRVVHRAFAIRSDAEFGFRLHLENQDRRQENGPLPTSRTGIIVESNIRKNQALSGFLQNRFVLGKLAITPGLRVERIYYERINNLANNGAGVAGRTDLTQLVPGVGAAYSVRDDLTLFSGIHRGFAPPRTEDIINNTSGGEIELDPELSWNYEVGLRGRLHPSAGLEATYFAMDYENQVVPASLAGGVGALLTNGGKTKHQGLELAGRFDLGTALGLRHNFYLRSAYTYIPEAKFAGTRFSSVAGSANVSVSGNRLPYSPRNLVTASVGYYHSRGWDAMVEAVHIGSQYGDDLNTIAASPDGQRGLLPSSLTWNSTLNYRLEPRGTTMFVTVKNLLDRTYIVDRARGILPSTPRLVQGGIKFQF